MKRRGSGSTREHCNYNPTKKTMPEDDRNVNGGNGCRMKSCGTDFFSMGTVPLQPDKRRMHAARRHVKALIRAV